MSLTKDDPADVGAPTGSKFTTRETGTCDQHAHEGSEVNVARVGFEGERGSGCGPGGAALDPAALPCQNSNNSDRKRYRLEPDPVNPGFFYDPNNNQVWCSTDEDTLCRLSPPVGPEAKSAFQLRLNVEAFIKYHGRDHCLFFTITDEEGLHPSEFARRWNNYLRRHGAWILSFIRVLEPQAKGRPHYHVLVAVPWDTQPDRFDWTAFEECREERRANGKSARFRELRERYRASAAPELVRLWALLRKVLPRYGLGRSELLPLRKESEAVAEYIGKYLEGGLAVRKHSWKGCRRIEMDRRNKKAWQACSRVFGWHSPGARKWRARVGEIGRAIGATDIPGITARLGRRWAYMLRDLITFADDAEWRALLQLIASGGLLTLRKVAN